MARNKTPRGIPSQNSVPQQIRFYHEFDSNVDRLSTARPTSAASSNFPGQFPMPKPRTINDMGEGQFMHRSNTNGKK
jgi:hypothetical protein